MYIYTHTQRDSEIWKQTYCFSIFTRGSYEQNCKEHTMSCFCDFRLYIWKLPWWICQIFLLIQHTVFSAHKTLYLLEFGCQRLFFLPLGTVTGEFLLISNLAMRQTFLSFLAFLWFTWHWIRRMNIFISFFLFKREGGRREQRTSRMGSKLGS